MLFDVIQLCEVEYDEENELQVMSHACRYDKPEKVKEFITKTFNNIDDADLAEVIEELIIKCYNYGKRWSVPHLKGD